MELCDELTCDRDTLVQQMFNDTLLLRNLSVPDVKYGLLPTSIKITVVVVYLIVCVVGLVGNFLVMYVIIRYTKMETVTNIYIFNLALADALLLATLPFQGTDVLLGFWPFGLALCKTVVAIDYYNMFTSIFTLTIMSVDRYIAVCHPVRSLTVRTPLRAKLFNVAVWVLASAVGLPVMIMGQVEEDVNGVECLVVMPDPRGHWEPVFVTSVFLCSFFIPVAIISGCYGLMVRHLRSVCLLSGSREKDRNLRRITYMVLSVVAAFVLCWMPVQVLVLIQALGKVDLGGSQVTLAAMHFCIALGYANSSLNPVLYAFLDENFKRCFPEFCVPTNSNWYLEDQHKKSLKKERECGVEEEAADSQEKGVVVVNPIPLCMD